MFQDDHIHPCLCRSQRGVEAGEPCANDGNVGFDVTMGGGQLIGRVRGGPITVLPWLL